MAADEMLQQTSRLSVQATGSFAAATMPSVSAEMRRFYASIAVQRKEKADFLAAQVHQRQDRMQFINEIIGEINCLTDIDNHLDLSKNVDILDKLEIARQLGVKIKEGQTAFTGLERDRLIENLHLAADKWDKDNRQDSHKMEKYLKELDLLMMMLKDTDRKEEQAKKPSLAGIRGAG